MEHSEDSSCRAKKTTTSLVSAFKSAQKKQLQQPSLPTTTTTRKKSVSFPQTLSSISSTTLSLDDYTDDEIDMCWYDRKELKDIQKTNAILIKRMSQGKPPKIGHSYRGLEDMTGQGHKLAEDRYDKALDIVLDFYDGQRMHGINNVDEATEEMASLYASVTKRCKLLAMATGLQDEIEAELAAKEIDHQDKQQQQQRTHGSSKRYTLTTRLTEKGVTTRTTSSKRRQPRKTSTRSKTRPGSVDSKSTKSHHKKATASKKAIPLPSANTLLLQQEASSIRSVPPAA